MSKFQIKHAALFMVMLCISACSMDETSAKQTELEESFPPPEPPGFAPLPSQNPQLLNLRITPKVPVPGNSVTCAYDFIDAQGDQDASTLQWRIEGELVPGETSSTLSGELFEKGEEIECVVTPSDGVNQGEPQSVSVRAIRFRLVQDLNPGPEGSKIRNIAQLGLKTFFWATDGQPSKRTRSLWVTDGDSNATRLINQKTGFGGGAMVFDSRLYFIHGDDEEGYTLWQSDGTVEGSVPVEGVPKGVVGADFGVGYPIWEPALIYASTSHLYFMASEGMRPRLLWVLDRKTKTPQSLQTYQGDLIDDVREVIRFQDKVAFLLPGYDVPWITDGTSKGTRPLIESDMSGRLANLVVFGNSMFFLRAVSEPTLQLWQSDGTSFGTSRVDASTWDEGKGPTMLGRMIKFREKLLLVSIESPSEYKLWGFEPSTQEAQLLQVFDAPLMGLYFEAGSQIYGEHMYFTTSPNTASASMIWRTDGTVEGTEAFKLPDDEELYDIFWLQEFGGHVYFATQSAYDLHVTVWATNGTLEGTHKVQQFNYLHHSDRVRAPASIFFVASQEETGSELWVME